ncbi:serine hydrolase-like protein [Battus philenor]|uniref:serine hydrolase-like protein n=1 Tax=Battus philenor TaxID=42288 RepID=UPI0035CF3C77
MKVCKEWFLEAKWGKIALISWGDPNGEPILLVHGRQDSSSTFIPLLEMLPDRYHYVAVDLPGNGLSDPIPKSVVLQRLFPVAVIQMVVDHLNWNKFTLIAHSMGGEIGLFYNAIFPDRCKRCIYLDTIPALQRLMLTDFSDFYMTHYIYYYDNYHSINNDQRIFSKEDALNAVMKARGMTRDQAEIILSRNLKKVGPDQYKLSWDKREKILAPMVSSPEHYYELFSSNPVPSLFICAQDFDSGYVKGKEETSKLISNLSTLKNIKIINVEGAHDVHFTNPERVIEHIKNFLDEDSNKTKSKL